MEIFGSMLLFLLYSNEYPPRIELGLLEICYQRNNTLRILPPTMPTGYWSEVQVMFE